MRLLFLFLLIAQFATALASEIQLNDGRLVTASLVIYSDQGAKLINHGATPDEFYSWSEIAEIGLGKHELELRAKFLKKEASTAATSSSRVSSGGSAGRAVEPDSKKVDLSSIFSGSESSSVSAPKGTGAKGKPATLADLKKAMPAPERAERATTSAAAEPITLDMLKKSLTSLSQISQLTSGRNFGLLIAGVYLLVSLIVFVVNFAPKKRLSWSEKPELIHKAVKSAFWLTVVPTILVCAALVYFPERLDTEALPLWLAALIAGGTLLLALGMQKKSRFCTLILLVATVAVTAIDFTKTQMSDISFMTSGVMLTFCVITFAQIDALFAAFHHHSNKREKQVKKPLPQTDLAEASV